MGDLSATGARIDLYGYSVGAGDAAGRLVSAIAAATHATVWAGNDPTGSLPGSNWDLETRSAASSLAPLLDANRLAGSGIELPWSASGTPGPDNIVSSGVSPALNTFEGTDTVTIQQGSPVTGTVDLGADDDTVNLHLDKTQFTAGRIDGNSGTDVMNIYVGSETAVITGDALAGTVTYTGPTTHVITWVNFETLNIYGGTAAGPMDSKVTVAHGASVDLIDMKDGNDTVTVAGSVNGNVYGGLGNDIITVTRSVAGHVYGDDGSLGATGGKDTITIRSSGVIQGSVYGEGRNDSIDNAGSMVGDVDGGDGKDTITNEPTGVVKGNVYGEDGNDIITNKGTIAHSIDSGAGNDIITNPCGAPVTAILAGTGGDVVWFRSMPFMFRPRRQDGTEALQLTLRVRDT